jgi:hypothetical protein
MFGAGVAELADARGLGPRGLGRAGSSPALGTTFRVRDRP